MEKGIKFLSFLLALLMTLFVIPTTSISSDATDSRYEVSDDGYCMNIYCSVEKVKVPSGVEAIFISDADILDPLLLDNGMVNHITFKNCNIFTSDLGKFKNLTAITMIDCRMTDLRFLSNHKKIDFLDIDSSYLTSIDGIQSLTELECLCLYDIGIESLEPIRNHKKLEQLVLSNTCVKDLSPIANMNIKELDISNTLTIRDLTPVTTLKNLRSFIGMNCEMSYTQKTYDYIRKNVEIYHLSSDWKNIQKSVKQIAGEIFSKGMSDRQIIEATVRYVTDTMEYDYNVETDDDLSIKYNDNALRYALKGKGACRNYTALTTVLLQEAGIDVCEIKSFNHIWNLIKLNGKYYWLDVTWLDDLTWEEVLESEYYMNDDYLFIDHEPLTIPFPMYKAGGSFPTDIEEFVTEEVTTEIIIETEGFTETDGENETEKNTSSDGETESQDSNTTENEIESQDSNTTENEIESQEDLLEIGDETQSDSLWIVIVIAVALIAAVVVIVLVIIKRNKKNQ